MGISAAVVWEFRATASANMANGGGFKAGASGTDWSLQDSPQYALTGVTSSAANAVMLTASASNDMIGNIARVVSGTNATVGWYEITGCTPGVSITVDRTWGSGAVASGVVNIGGALNTGGTIENTWTGSLVAGHKIWIKSGSYTVSQTISTGSGSASAPILWQGYTSTRGDTCNDTSRPILDFGASTLWNAPTSNRWENIILKGSNTNVLAMGSISSAINCKFINYSTTAGRNAFAFNSSNGLLLNCEAVSYRGVAVNLAASNSNVVNCYIHDSVSGIAVANTGAQFIVGNIIESCGTAAINCTSAPASFTLISGNTLYGSEAKTGTGIIFATGTVQAKVLSNIIYGFTTGISHADVVTAHKTYEDYNFYYNNTTNATNITLGSNSLTTQAPTFGNAAQLTGATATTSGSDLTQAGANFSTVTANRDFCNILSGTGVTTGQYLITAVNGTTITLDSAPGTDATADKTWQITTGRVFTIGTNLKARGYPRTIQPIALNTSYTDPGALQRQESASGGMVKRRLGYTSIG